MAKKNNANLGYVDLTKTGPLSYRQLQMLNSRLPAESAINAMHPDNPGVSTMLSRVGKVNYTAQPTGLGESIYDPGIANQHQIENLQDVRAEAQPWYAKIGAGLAKGAILAGTTFLDGTVGLLIGSAEAATRKDWSGLWDNDFSRTMQAVNEWSEEVLPNYYSTEEQNSPWYENIFTANFIGDKFIKNLGFSVGALYSGGVTSAGLKLTKLPQLIGAITKGAKAPAMVSSAVGAITSAVNEGRIEALNNSKDWQNLKIQELDDNWAKRLDAKYAPQMESLAAEYQAAAQEYEATKGKLQKLGADGAVVDPAFQRYQAKLEALEQRRAALQDMRDSEWENRGNDKIYRGVIGKIEEDRLKMGNTDMLANLPILTFSNMVQFTKFYANGFNTARRAGVRTVSDAAEGAARYAGKTFSKGKAALKVTKGALSEGTEEISQKATSLVIGNYYSTDVNNFYKSQIDPNAEQETLDWAKSFANGINETVNDGSSWEEFFIGALTGLMGVPTFRSMRSKDGSLRSPVTLQGGAINEIREYRENIARSQEIANYLNQRVQSPEFLNYYRGMIRHNKYQTDMNKAAEDDDEFNFKNAEHAQFVSDIIMFDNAGKLGDLKTYINAAYDMSDENLQSIVENTTTTVTDENGEKKTIGPFVDSKGNPMYDTEEGKKQMIDKLTQTRDNMLSTLNDYKKTKNDLDVRTGGQLSDEQLSEMTWLKTQIDDWTKRAGEMTPLVKKTLVDLSNNLETVLARSISDASMDSEEAIESTSQAANAIGIGTDRIQQLRMLSRMGDEKLSAILTSPKNIKFVEGLIEDISTFGSDIINTLDRENVVRLMQDLPKIGKGIETYSNKLEEYLTDPAKIAESQAKAAEEVRQNIQKKKSKDIRTNLSSAETLKEFKAALNQEDDTELSNSVIDDLVKEGNQVAVNYKETTQYDSELKKALIQLGESDQTVQDALALWGEQINLAENLKMIANPNSVAINNEEAFMEDSGGNIELASSRFENARYVLQRAMSKVNNDIKFKNRFSEEYRKPVNEPSDKGPEKDETGDSGTATVPHVNPGAAPVEVPSAPVGNVTAEMVAAENSDANRRVETQRTFDQRQQGQRRYYRPAVPELHIEASKEGDFRPFDVVVAEREPGVDFSGIYSYLRDNGAFNYVNTAKLKPGDTLGFMIDPEFNDHTIFLVDTRNNQIVGSIDESDASVARYEGLENLIKRVRDEYQVSRSGTDTEKVVSTNNSQSPSQRYDKFEDVAIITTTYNGFRRNTDSQDWSNDASDIRTKPDGWGVHKGLIYYKRAINGRAGDNTTIWLRTPVTERGQKELETVFNSMTSVTEENKAALLGIINDNQVQSKPNPTGKFFATPQTRVSKIMVGRIPYSTEERSLADIPGVIDGDTKPILGVIKNGVLTTNEKIDDRLIIKPVDMTQKEGRLYLLIPNAAGTYSPAAVRVKHFNTQEFNLDDTTVAATPIGKKINSVIDKLANSTNDDDITNVLKDLNDVLYARDLHIDYFSSPQGEGIRIVKVQRDANGDEIYETNNKGERVRKEDKSIIYYQNSKSSITYNGMYFSRETAERSVKEGTLDPSVLGLFGQPRDISDIKKDILNALLRHNLPLQVSASKINDSGYNNRVIKSNILTSNLREAKVIGSWFITDYFDNQGKPQKAISPASAKPTPSRRGPSSTGGTGSVAQGTRVLVSGTPYIVDLKHNVAINEKTGEKRSFSEFNSKSLIDMAWAQENFGDATESSRMTENKIITPDGNVLDRNTGHYLTGEEAQRIKDKIAGRTQETEDRIAQSKRIIASIKENQEKVDKTRTDENYYYILEEDGQYHQYSRVHTRLGDNWLGKKTKTENSRRALEAGSAVDKVIRDFFTSDKAPVRPETLSETAFIDLISKLTEIKSKMEQLGETFMTNNIVLFQKYADGTRIAGEVDILSVDKNGNFKIYDVKTSQYSFSGKYFNEKSSMQKMSNKDYYTLQLSAYQNLFESQYGVRPTKLAILPFVLSYGTTQVTTTDIPAGSKTNLGLPVGGSEPYFRSDKKVEDNEARFVSSEKDGNVYFKPILDTKAHENTLLSTDAAKGAVEFIGGDPKEARSLIMVKPGRAIKTANRVVVQEKAKVFVVTPSTPYSNTRSVVTSVVKEKGIPITYNPAVNVPLAVASRPIEKAKAQPSTSASTNLPIFDSAIETMITNPKEQDRVLPENAFEEGGKIGFYEKDGKLYTGYLKKIGEIEVTYGSGQKDMVPIHITKVRDRGFGRPGEFGASSEYIAVFPNGKAISPLSGNDSNDDHAARIIMDAFSAKPEKVLALSSEKTQIYNPRMLEELEIEQRNEQYTPSTPTQGTNTAQQGGATKSLQKSDSVNQHDDEFEDDLVLLRKVDSTRPTWNKEKELAWLKKVLPQLSEQDRVKIIEGLIQVSENGPVAWGMFSDGIVTLSDIAAKGTTYHEAFHVVFNLMLTPQEREALLEEARQLYGDKSELSLEEDMAEGFREYVTSQESRGLGRRILDFFKNLFAKITNWKYMKPSLTAYYQMINQGRYRNANLGVSSASRLRQEEYTPEMESIKNKAISDGTFMKAPNGNPTNLNERQWLQVRTKAFKEWFGDWESFTKVNPYNTNIILGKPEADYDSVDADGFGTIIPVNLNGKHIGNIALNNTFNGSGFNVNGQYVSMPEVGNPVEIEEEFRGKGYGKSMYFELAKQIANLGRILISASDSSRTPASTRVWESLVRDGYAKKVGNRYEFINQTLSEASKVVDENGEPLVVYHGTSKEFNTFNTDINLEVTDKQGNLQNVLNLPNSIYATSNEVMATTYYENESFLDKQLDDIVERIYETEYKGLISLKERDNRIKEVTDAYNKRKKLLKGKNIPLFVNLKNVKIIDAKNSNWNKINDNGIIKSTRDLEEENRDKDGVIIYNVFDFGGRGGYIGYQPSTVFIINKSNDVKSATSNNGEFSTTNNDIRYRTVPNSSWSAVDNETRQSLEAKGWTQEKFNSISQAERDNAVECVGL